MAFASVGTLGGGGFKATQTTMALTLAAAAEAGNLVILVVGADDTTSDLPGPWVTAVTDSAGGNLWVRARESSVDSAAAGASVSVWYCNVRNQINSAGTITATFSSRGAGGITAWEFTKAAGTEASLIGTNADTGAASAMLSTSLNVTTPNEPVLRFRAGAGEEELTTTGTKTAAFTALIGVTGTSGTGGLNATNIILRGEYLISTATGQASLPTGMPTCDWASVYIALREVPVHAFGSSSDFSSSGDVPALHHFAVIGT
jgi:hypothetical protein